MLKKTTYYIILFIHLCIFSTATADRLQSISATQEEACELPGQVGPRFIKLNGFGKPLSEQHVNYQSQAWSCVLDRNTNLVWEVKTPEPGLHSRDNRYTWYSSNPLNNGSFKGYANKGVCTESGCDTQAFIATLNTNGFCGSRQWRLPNREELRSLINYDTPFPGPTLNRHYFPNTLSQYYWSASPDSDDKDSVWGIGFSFGYDYTYFKSHAGYVRAVQKQSQ